MTEENVALIIKAIGDARQESSAAIGVLSTHLAKFEGNIEARVKATEEYISTEKKWGRAKSIANVIAVPLYGIGHAIAAHLGIKI